MEILIQSALERKKSSDHSLHVRYWEWKREPPGESQTGEIHHEDGNGSTHSKITSYVIIHREYGYLEPIVRAMFSGAEDVKIVVDRRRSERSEMAGDPWTDNPRTLFDRRRSSPMLDIVIKMTNIIDG